MQVLLLSMPDSFEHMAPVAVRMPNGALTSLAGNIDAHHRVAVADLILVQGRVVETVTDLATRLSPDIVGLSVMTFQRRSAHRLITLLRRLLPQATIVVGGYDPSLAPDAYGDERCGADVIVRGDSFDNIPGLSWRNGSQFVHNPDRPVSQLRRGELRLPRREVRVLEG